MKVIAFLCLFLRCDCTIVINVTVITIKILPKDSFNIVAEVHSFFPEEFFTPGKENVI